MPHVASEAMALDPYTVPAMRIRPTVRERNERHCCCGLTVRDLITICSTVLIPLIFGLFTVVITIYQQRIAQLQRKQDLEISHQQRAHDIELAQQQRAEDRKQAELLRKQDLEIAELRREQELNISIVQALAADRQHKHDLSLADNLQKESVLVGYLKEMADLLDKNKFTLDNHVGVSIVRPKTLSALRQLDSHRKVHLIRFLYESELIITGKNPLDLSDADLDGIDLSFLNLDSISLKSVHMRHALLIRANLSFADFSNSLLTSTNFSGTKMSVGTKFYWAQAEYADFSRISSVKVNMNRIDAHGASFRFASLNQATFHDAHLQYADFEGASVRNADFYLANLENSTIIQLQLQEAVAFEGLILPNLNIGDHKNIIFNGNAEQKNGQYDCTVKLTRPIFALLWDSVKNRRVIAIAYNSTISPSAFIPDKTVTEPNQCYFTAFSDEYDRVSMYQRVELLQYTEWINDKILTFFISARMGVNNVGTEWVSVDLLMKTSGEVLLVNSKNILRNGSSVKKCVRQFFPPPNVYFFDIYVNFERLFVNNGTLETFGYIDDIQVWATRGVPKSIEGSLLNSCDA
ncbi:unnamed protein product [Rotaria sp. Silwood1]|nr:unnamed protein product [Rotaria sp. Silwood1]CAF3564945.1 unnamed protein product [Rotaria sp. Silwood1]CAF3665623.1 unnamed protein product [Rotaria sp. Silwood1]CAF4685518.1 unnamed protein product [Rotaria sp. Silwood1]CAF4765087.1 unnamed protein product [Rotaria sp. Silwood1]